jgi:hypothetical protein
MRTTDLTDTTSWRFWDGTGFTLQPLNPYVNGVSYATAVANPTAYFGSPIDPNIDVLDMASSVTYNTYLQKYLLIGSRGAPALGFKCGFYYSLSDDLIHWSPVTLFREAHLPQCGSNETVPWNEYPSIIDHSDTSDNFENSDDTFHLYFVRYSTGPDRDLVRVPVTITLD